MIYPQTTVKAKVSDLAINASYRSDIGLGVCDRDICVVLEIKGSKQSVS